MADMSTEPAGLQLLDLDDYPLRERASAAARFLARSFAPPQED